MNKSLQQIGFIALLLFLSFSSLFAQQSFGGHPLSFKLSLDNKLNTKTFNVPKINLKKILQEDDRQGGTRFAAPTKVNLNLDNAGVWTELSNGDRVWQLKIQSKGALGLVILYDDFWLPKGAKFYSYSEDHQQIIGAYTSESNPKSGRFLTGLIRGETSILEYYEPASVKGKGRISIFRIDHAYHKERLENDYEFKLHSAPLARGFGTSLDCHVNVNCDAGNDWQNEKKGVTRIMLVVEEGTGWCSGTLVNNAREDGKPYVLSAFHCDDGFTPLYDLWRFDFNYEASACANPVGEPAFQSVLGCTYRAGRRESDFQLLETNPLPVGFNTYLNGWNHSDTAIPTKGTMIHHPSGDIKKISHDNDALTIFPGTISWMETGVVTPANHHFKAVLDVGTFEVGSSGSPLFDQNHRVVGQLNGGNASCSEFLAYYGRLSKSWDAGTTASTRLKDWLDPDNTGVETLDGKELTSNNADLLTFKGTIKTAAGKGIPGVVLSFSGLSSGPNFITTNSLGEFSIQLPKGQAIAVALSKNNLPRAGISVRDAVALQQYALGKAPYDSPYQFIASDLNRSGTISVSDLVILLQIALGKLDAFPNVNSWLFLEANKSFANPKDALTAPLSQSFNYLTVLLQGDELVQDFIGVKMADVNASVIPE